MSYTKYINSKKNKCSGADLREAQVTLETLPGSQNTLDGGVWEFRGATRIRIDFERDIEILSEMAAWRQSIGIDLELFLKIILINQCKGKRNVGYIKHAYDALLKTLYYLALNDKKYVTRNNLSDYYSFILMHELYNGL